MTKGHWPILAQHAGFLVDVFQLWRCHSIFSCLHYSLHSAIFFCLEINKMYYIHIASMPGSFCCSPAFSLFSSAVTRLDTENVHQSHAPSPLCTFVLVCLHCSAWVSHRGDGGSLHISGLWPCQVSRASVLYLQQLARPLLALSRLLFIFFLQCEPTYIHTHTNIYTFSPMSWILKQRKAHVTD